VTLSRHTAQDQLEVAGLRAKRALGQNFVVDPNTVRRIARLSGAGPTTRVVEVGAGLGSLTLALAETGAQVVAVEIDVDLVPILRANVAGCENVRVVEADAMTIDWNDLLGPDDWMLVANLPYNVATPLVADILDTVPQVKKMVVMVQREVAEKLLAHPPDPAYGAPSVQVGLLATGRILRRYGPEVFWPQPRVQSALLRLVPRAPALLEPRECAPLAAFVTALFGMRRKMLSSSLGMLVEGVSGADVAEALHAAGLGGTQRPQEVRPESMLSLWRALGRPAGRVIAPG